MGIFDSITGPDRWLLAAALSNFADKLAEDRAVPQVVAAMGRLRSEAVHGCEPPTPPEGVEIDETAFLQALATVRLTNNFTIYLLSSFHLEDSYDLVIETNGPQYTRGFTVAGGLSGTGRFFELSAVDLEFAAQVEHAVFMASGYIPVIGSNEVLTLTMRWDDLDGPNPETAVRDHVRSLVGDAVRVRESLIDDHPDLREDGYAQVTAYVGGPATAIAGLRTAEAARLQALGEERSPTF
jgi:hypothetical protein